MRRFVFFILSCLTLSIHAATLLDAEGHPDPALVSAFVSSVAPHIRDYPPRFVNKQQEDDVRKATQFAINELSSVDLSRILNQELLTSIAFTFAMAHNLDLGTGSKAKHAYELALALNPEDRRTNYLFGMFLASTRKYHFESLPFLQKAYALGEVDALFTIGLLLVNKGEKEKGLEALQSYADRHPQPDHVLRVIQGIKDGKYSTHYK